MPDETKQERTEAASTIAEQLGESEPMPRQTIERSVKVLGSEGALTFLKRTLEIEVAGGMMLPDGTRRRTPGGVYFYLIRKEVSQKQRMRIFPMQAAPEQRQGAATSGESSASEPVAAAVVPVKMTWAERGEVLDETEEEKGEIRSVKMTLIGRPGKIVERGQCVTFTMQQSEKIPPLPSALPLPSAQLVGSTRYDVYVAAKQWRKVSESMKDPEDVLIIEGFPVLDKERGTIAVFGSNVTTKLTQMARKQQQKEASS